MKNIYFNSELNNKACYFFLQLFFLFGMIVTANAQLRVPFTQRTSQYTPDKKIYNIKGDYAMIGNTNMTLQNYADNTQNGNNNMVYTDIDSDSNTFNSSSSNLTFSSENGAIPSCSNIIYAGLYWTGRASKTSPSNNTFTVTKNSVTKTFDKRIISLKGPNSSTYTQITAASSDIYYPTTSDGFMYSAYAEVTDYVRNNGLGTYFAADIALIEGNDDTGTGYYGGWSLIVIYENNKMKYRDVTIFDGHAYVAGNVTADFEIPVSGFNTVQSGQVNMKLGLMAGEGDRGISGDYFQVRNHTDANWIPLNHSGNSTTNFFNSSIQTGGNTRNPNLLNNTGLDIGVFNIPNSGNSVITNNQTSTRFKYGTTQDTFVIFAIAMSVDAYIPQVEALITAANINGSPAVQPYTILPGQEAGYSVDIKNLGTEAVNNYKIIVPIPYNATYVTGSASGTIFSPQTSPTPNSITFNPSLGATGSIVWDFGTLVLPANPSSLLARLTFRLRSTTDCAILSNATCSSNMSVVGNSTGIGAITNVALNNSNFIQGYNQNGTCVGEPIPTPINIAINGTNYVSQNCPNTSTTRNFSYCSASTSIGTSLIASNFPPGSKFYNSFPVTTSSIQYTDANPIPLVSGSTITYYAVPSGGGSGCNFPFTITKCPVIVAQNDALAGGNGTTLNPNIGNVLSNNGSGSDTLNGVQALISQVNITVTTPATPINGNPAPILDPLTGQVSVPAGTPAGTYTIVYNLCEKLNPLANCDPATVTIIVTTPAIVAVNNTYTNINCTTSGLIGNVLANDTLNGAPFASNLVTFTLLTGSNPTISFSSNGDVNITSGIAAGVYTFTYKICQILNPTNCSNIATISITVVDITVPVISTLPATSTISCPATPIFTTPTASDTCSSVTLTSNDVRTNGACAGSYSITRTWTATDASGNTATASQTIIVQDTTAPTWTTTANALNTTLQCSDAAGLASAQALAPTATDNCGGTVTYTKTSGIFTAGSCPNNGTHTNTWVAKDVCNNSSSTFTQVITIQDTTAPTWTTAATALNTSLECSDAAGLATAQALAPTATDNCGGTVTYTKTSGTFTTGSCANNGTYTNTWVAKDVCNNSSSTFTQVITIQDTTAPTWITAAASLNTTIECSDETAIAAAQAQFPVAADNCDSDVTNIIKNAGLFVASSTCANAGTYTNTWTVTDACGNTSEVFTQVITIQDTTSPTWSTAAASLNTTIECSDATAIVAAQALFPSATDNCDNDVTNIVKIAGQFVASEECSNAGSYTNTWTVTDACGNTSEVFTQVITIQDTTSPTWSTTAASLDATIECSNATAIAAAQALFPSATDNCDSDVTNIVKNEGQFVASEECPNAGTYTNTWTVTDACGNTSSVFTQVITIQDSTAPTWSTAATSLNATIECSDATAIAAAQALFPSATDNCDSDVTNIIKNVGQFVASEECPNAGSYTNTWTITDACGNTSSVFTQVITIQDTTAPTWSTTAASLNATIECSNATAIAAAQAQFPVAADNCDSDVTNIIKTAGQFAASEECPNAGTYTNTWTVTDACGNTSSVFTQVITIQDTTSPTWSTNATSLNATIECSDATAIAAAQAQFPIATDNCDSDVINIVKNAGQFVASEECSNAGTYTNTWTVTDACGNTSEAFTQVITIQDTTAPTWSTTAASLNATIECSNATAIAAAQAQFPSATDNCDSDVTNIIKTAGQFVASEECPNAGTYTNTWTVTDACNNTSELFTQVITIQDTTSPTWTTAAASLNATIECSDIKAIVAAQALLPSATDNCDSDVTNIVKNAGQFLASEECSNAGTYTNTWTVTDACGNTSEVFTQIITIQDTTAPTWTTAAASLDATIECSDANGLAAAQAQFPSATDNCDNDVTNIIKNAGRFVTSEECPNAGILTNTWTVTDACGNTSSVFTQVITIQDTTAPIINFQATNAIVECDGNGNAKALAAWLASNGGASASDACSEVTWSNNFIALSDLCGNTGSATVSFTAIDNCGNSSTTSATFTIQDTLAPESTTEYELKIQVTCSTIPEAPQLVFNDNCSGNVTPEFTQTQSETLDNMFTIIRTWIATDSCGNISQTYIQTIQVTVTSDLITLPSVQTSNNIDENISLVALLPSGVTGGTWANVNNVGGFDPINITFNPFEIASGDYIFSYTINDGSCLVRYDVLIIVGQVNPCELIVIYNAFTPNGDNINEWFQIENIEDFNCYPSNTVEIYNRWGVLVYETKNYDNNTSRFEGISEGRTTVNKSDELPTGTYFYLIQWTTTDGQTVTKDGYLYLTR